MSLNRLPSRVVLPSGPTQPAQAAEPPLKHAMLVHHSRRISKKRIWSMLLQTDICWGRLSPMRWLR